MGPLRAKSGSNGGWTLVQHTQHVLDAIKPLARAWNFDAELARRGAILHDLGKGHPRFQQQISDDDEGDLRHEEPHRHELSSLLFLPLFPCEEWDLLIEMVVAHHKSVAGDAKRRGLLDLTEDTHGLQWTFEQHAGDWEAWATQVCAEVLPAFGIQAELPMLEAARTAFDYAVQYCRRQGPGWSRWRGLLMAADHFASHFNDETATRAGGLFIAPCLDYFERRSDLHPLSLRPADDARRHTLVVAPTGAGKTDYLLRRCGGRVFYVLPYQASINAMFERIDKALKNYGTPADVRRVHAASRLSLKKDDWQEETQDLQRHPGASVKVMTPHQLASILFGTSGHEAAALDVAGCDVILDEVHVYGEYAQAMVLELVRALRDLGCRLHIGTATLPPALASRLLDLLGGAGAVYEVRLSKDELRSFNRHRVHKHHDEQEAWTVLSEALAAGERVLWVSNRVDWAQRRFAEARSKLKLPKHALLLVHSRFRREDRNEREQDIYRLEKGAGPCLVCTTQVVEVSLDISFDRMLTDAASLDALVQRFGRVNRRRTPETIGKLRPVHVFPVPPNEALPYAAGVVQKSFELLPNGAPLEETALQDLLHQVYPTIEPKDITPHLFRQNGTYTLRALRHRPKAWLLEALDIEAYSVILESDRSAYEKKWGAERVELEIPVSRSALFPVLRHTPLEQVRVGHYPFVVQEEWYDPDLGLVLPKFKADALGGVFL